MSSEQTHPSNAADAQHSPKNRLKKKLAYSLAAGAATGAIASDADAAIQYSGIYNIAVGQGYFQPLGLDFAQGNFYADINFYNSLNFNGPYQGVGSVTGTVVGFNAGPYNFAYVSALSEDDPIDATTVGANSFGSLAYGANNPNAEFNNANGAFVGLSFDIGGNLHYGWVRVDIDNAAGTLNIRDWAYQDVPGVGIPAGAIPEPGTLGLLAAGSAGLLAMRRRKAA